MAGNRLTISTADGGVAVSTAWKTVLNIKAPTNHGLNVNQLQLAGQSSTSTEKLRYRFLIAGTGGTAGAGSPVISSVDTDQAGESHGVTADQAYSAEPTGGRIIMPHTLNGVGGDRVRLGLRLKPGERLCLQCIATTSNTVDACFDAEV